MIKCFLSHSSSDKERYVRIVANHLKREIMIFDEKTFEEGMVTAEEIMNGLDESTLFVIFLSNTALESEWVKKELADAKLYLDEGKIKRVYPIIIDENLKFSDPRIPGWLKETTNIQHILRPRVAAKKINARLIELSWDFHPQLKEREKIFVGRNALIDEIEERLDDFRKLTPSVILTSGLPSIGRKALLKHAARKANVVRESYEFPLITLAPSDSIEDFILKIHDLGFSEHFDIKTKLQGEVEEKISLAIDIIDQVGLEREKILIEDNGVIVQFDGKIVDWFVSVVSAIKVKQEIIFFIASRLRPSRSINHKNEAFYCLYVDELQPAEREGLLVRYSKFKKLRLTKEDLAFFSEILTGFAEQVIYSVDLIDDIGVYEAKGRSHEIQEYSSDKAKLILERYSKNQDIVDFIYLLSKFEFLSYDLIFSIVDEKEHAEILKELLATAVCERLGSNGEYIRVNEVVRDYISRGRFGIPEKYINSLNSHVVEYLENYSDENEDLSDYMFSVQRAILTGKDVPRNLLIPSVLIKSIKKLYDEDRNYKDAMRLCDRVLQNEKGTHINSIDHVRFIKCQCLARIGDSKHFFEDVQDVNEPDKSFLIGFYYRLAGQFDKAKYSFERVLSQKPNDLRAKGELIQVYLQTEEYELAYDMAKSNYLDRSGNPININNYITCIIHREKTPENRKELEKAYHKLSIDSSERSQEMAFSVKARLLAFYDHNYDDAFTEIEEAVSRFPSNDYPLLTMADLAVYSRKTEKLREAIALLEERMSRKAQSYRSFLKFKAYLYALEGDISSAKRLIENDLKGLGVQAVKRFLNKVEELSSS
ncbi:TIR domain-containing protein [Vreelandella titanicae]|uniref:TIR domain-containing protein n=1 Tax=Vreelandella titanicae TaxID=664683 RepID=UPI003D015447|tara:strand:+ start:60 stop:2525 length:2466 start_codon:yes stop_codon:yes gene_type:complete